MDNFLLQSSAFSNGEEIPRKYGYKNGNISPPLSITGVPSDSKSLVLIMDDPDAKAAVGKVWVHWIVWNIDPSISEIVENSLPSDCVQGKTDFNEISYGGPAPPDKRHTYVFKLYALNKKLDLNSNSTKDQLENIIEGSIIQQTKLEGTYAP